MSSRYDRVNGILLGGILTWGLAVGASEKNIVKVSQSVNSTQTWQWQLRAGLGSQWQRGEFWNETWQNWSRVGGYFAGQWGAHWILTFEGSLTQQTGFIYSDWALSGLNGQPRQFWAVEQAYLQYYRGAFRLGWGLWDVGRISHRFLAPSFGQAGLVIQWENPHVRFYQLNYIPQSFQQNYRQDPPNSVPIVSQLGMEHNPQSVGLWAGLTWQQAWGPLPESLAELSQMGGNTLIWSQAGQRVKFAYDFRTAIAFLGWKSQVFGFNWSSRVLGLQNFSAPNKLNRGFLWQTQVKRETLREVQGLEFQWGFLEPDVLPSALNHASFATNRSFWQILGRWHWVSSSVTVEMSLSELGVLYIHPYQIREFLAQLRLEVTHEGIF